MIVNQSLSSLMVVGGPAFSIPSPLRF